MAEIRGETIFFWGGWVWVPTKLSPKQNFVATPLARRIDQGPAGEIRVPRDESAPARRTRALNTNQCFAEQIRALWDTPGRIGGPAGRSRASAVDQDESGPRRTNQGPAGRIRAPGTNQGPRTDQGPQGPLDEPGPRKTNQGPARRNRVRSPPQDESGPRTTNQFHAGRIRTTKDESGPRRTWYGPQ